MATRRPRVKAAAILKPRRQPLLVANPVDNAVIKIDEKPKLIDTTGNESNATTDKLLVKESVEPVSDSRDNQNEEQVNACSVQPTSTTSEPEVINGKNQNHEINSNETGGSGDNDSNDNDSKDESKSTVPTTSIAPKRFRRILPTVNLPPRRKVALSVNTNNVEVDNSKSSQTATSPAQLPEIVPIRSPSPTKAETKSILTAKAESMVSATCINVPSPVKEDYPQRRETIDNDDCFKSPPFMSPSMQYSRRQDPPSSPFPDNYGDDYAKSPSSNASGKIRQRIRPTPYFMTRRNSIQVS